MAASRWADTDTNAPHFFLAVSTRGHCYNTLDILLVYPRQEMSLKMRRNVCVTLAFFDKSRQRTSGILFSHDIRGLFISALLRNIQTWYKAWLKKKKKNKKKMDMNNEKWLYVDCFSHIQILTLEG